MLNQADMGAMKLGFKCKGLLRKLPLKAEFAESGTELVGKVSLFHLCMVVAM